MKTKHILLAVVFSIAAPSQAWAKRLPPPVVDPVEHEGVKYIAPNEDGEQAIVRAQDAKTGRLLWTKTVFTVAIDPELERDVQSIFIKSMSVKGDTLVVIDERGRTHRLDLEAEDDKAPPAKLSREESLHAVRQIAMACHLFAADNDGKLPASPKDLAGYLEKDADFSPFDLVTKDISISKIEDPASTVLVQTKASWNGKRAAAFVDGHAELVPAKQDGAGDN